MSSWEWGARRNRGLLRTLRHTRPSDAARAQITQWSDQEFLRLAGRPTAASQSVRTASEQPPRLLATIFFPFDARPSRPKLRNRMPARKKQAAAATHEPSPTGTDGGDRLRGLLSRLKQLEGEKKLLLVEFEKRRDLRERQRQALVAERGRTERRLDRMQRHLLLLHRASERIQRIVQRLKLIQQQQERLADDILSRLERSAIVDDRPPARFVPVPRARVSQGAEPTRPRPYPALPGWRRPAGERPEGERREPGGAEDGDRAEDARAGGAEAADPDALETLSAREAAEAKAALLSILQDIHAFREKREEIEKEVDRLKHL